MNTLHAQFEVFQKEYQAQRYPGRLADEMTLPPKRLSILPWAAPLIGLAAAFAALAWLNRPQTPTEVHPFIGPVAVATETPAVQITELYRPELPEDLFEAVDSWPSEAGTVPTLPSFLMWEPDTLGSTSSPATQESV